MVHACEGWLKLELSRTSSTAVKSRTKAPATAFKIGASYSLLIIFKEKRNTRVYGGIRFSLVRFTCLSLSLSLFDTYASANPCTVCIGQFGLFSLSLCRKYKHIRIKSELLLMISIGDFISLAVLHVISSNFRSNTAESTAICVESIADPGIFWHFCKGQFWFHSWSLCRKYKHSIVKSELPLVTLIQRCHFACGTFGMVISRNRRARAVESTVICVKCTAICRWNDK